MTEHTPGPWVVGGPWPKISICQPEADGDPWNFITWMWDDWAVEAPDEVKANATLIAAAPELLEACEAALEYLDHADISYANGNTHNGIDEGEHYGGIAHCSLIKELRAAIKKAKGETK